MPYIVSGEQHYSYYSKEYDYKYPDDLDLRPWSDLHNDIKSKIMRRANESRTSISKKFSGWNEIDKIMSAYIHISEEDKIRKSDTFVVPSSIVFPYTYSMLEALLTYLSMAFFQDPIFQYDGVEDSDTLGAMLLEMVIRLHCIKNKVALSIHNVLRDSLVYGIGIGIPGWKVCTGKVPVKSEGDDSKLFTFVPSVIFEGNDLSSIDPYLFLPDPSVSSSNVQDGEYVGWIDNTNYVNLLNEERTDRTGSIFNVRYLKDSNKGSSLSIKSSRNIRSNESTNVTSRQTSTSNIVDVVKMYVNIIPKDWKLGDSEYPEKWFFAIANDDVIISCHKADHNHGMYPIAVASPEADGYSIAPVSRIEILYGLQKTLDFLFNSHIRNVRKAVNDMIVVDPYLINIKDLEDPKPGKLIKLRKPAWGRGVSGAIQQLIVNDITRANIADSSYVTNWMDRISGADQSMLGIMRQSGPERLTKSEFQGTRGSAISRLQRIAMIISYQFMHDIGNMFAVHTQQYMSKDVYVKAVGRNADKLASIFGKSSKRVSIYDILVNYDVIVRDGTIGGDNFTEAWMNMFSTIASSPELMQQFDMFRLFSFIANQLGAKNVDDFKKVSNMNVGVMPDEEVIKQVQAGNMVDISQLQKDQG